MGAKRRKVMRGGVCDDAGLTAWAYGVTRGKLPEPHRLLSDGHDKALIIITPMYVSTRNAMDALERIADKLGYTVRWEDE